MIAANGVTARFLDRAASRRCAASSDRRSAGIGSARWPRSSGTRCPPRPIRSRCRSSSTARRRRTRARSPDLSLTIIRLLGSRRIRRRSAGRRAAGTLRPRRARLLALDRAEPALSGSRHAAAAQGGARRPPVAVRHRRARDGSRRSARRQEDAANKVERQVRKSAAAMWCSRASARRSTRSSPARRTRGPSCACGAADRGQARWRRAPASTSATASASARRRRHRPRLHRLPARVGRCDGRNARRGAEGTVSHGGRIDGDARRRSVRRASRARVSRAGCGPSREPTPFLRFSV